MDRIFKLFSSRERRGAMAWEMFEELEEEALATRRDGAFSARHIWVVLAIVAVYIALVAGSAIFFSDEARFGKKARQKKGRSKFSKPSAKLGMSDPGPYFAVRDRRRKKD